MQKQPMIFRYVYVLFATQLDQFKGQKHGGNLQMNVTCLMEIYNGERKEKLYETPCRGVSFSSLNFLLSFSLFPSFTLFFLVQLYFLLYLFSFLCFFVFIILSHSQCMLSFPFLSIFKTYLLDFSFFQSTFYFILLHSILCRTFYRLYYWLSKNYFKRCPIQ